MQSAERMWQPGSGTSAPTLQLCGVSRPCVAGVKRLCKSKRLLQRPGLRLAAHASGQVGHLSQLGAKQCPSSCTDASSDRLESLQYIEASTPLRDDRLDSNAQASTSYGIAPGESVSADKKASLRRKPRSRRGSSVYFFDIALEHGDIPQCLYRVRQLLASCAAAGTLTTTTSAGQLDASAVSSQVPSPAARKQVWQLLRGRHQHLLHICLTQDNLAAALQYVQLMPPEPMLYSTLLKECLTLNNLEGMQRVLEVRAGAGLQPDKYSYSALLSAAGKAGDTEAVRGALKEAWELGIRDTYVCNAAITAYAKAGDAEAAFQVYEDMWNARIAADRTTFPALLIAAGATGSEQRVQQVHEWACVCSLGPDKYTFSATFNAAAQCDIPTAGWLFQVFDDMKNFGVRANNAIMVSFFAACTKAALTGEEINHVFKLFGAFRASHKPVPQLYTALLTLCNRGGVSDKAVAIWEAIEDDGIELNGYLYSALFSLCGRGGTPEQIDLAARVLHQMDRQWLTLHSQQSNNSAVSRSMLVAYNAAIKFLDQVGRLEEAWQVYTTMNMAGPCPDDYTFNTLIAAFARGGDKQKAVWLFSQMQHSGLRPTEHTFGSLLAACAKVKDPDAAKQVFQMMKDQGVRATVESYTALIDACVKEGSPPSLQMAFSVFDEMKAANVMPSAVTYGCLLVACEEQRDVEAAFALYQEACVQGVAPSDGCHNMLIKICSDAGRLEDALELVKQLARKHGDMQQHTLNSLTRALSAQYPHRALRLLSIMRTLAMTPSRQTLNTLVSACARSGNSAEAENMYWELRAQHQEVTREAGSDLIVSLCAANACGRAYRVYQDMTLRASGNLRQDKKTKQAGKLLRSGIIPDVQALGALVMAFACAGDLQRAFFLFKQMQSNRKGLAQLTMTRRRMWESLIEASCRAKRTSAALQIFDEWKLASTTWLRLASPDEIKGSRFPKLSNVTLAFLEACCRGNPEHQWRVYDVCAMMRQQKERKHEALLDHPPKRSHHVYDKDFIPSTFEPAGVTHQAGNRAVLRERLMHKHRNKHEPADDALNNC